jgi:DNA repair protein RecN (Recombination protein N)
MPMLCNLVVENYALISKLEIEFRKGLTIITGETGAGKSILMGALSLILGKRADSNVLFDKEKKCIVEGTFDITRYGLEPFLNDNGIEPESQTYVRREISVSGKSRAFINDTPVTLETLSEFGKKLIDIHSQHQNLELANSFFQMMVIDNYAHNNDLLKQYEGLYEDYLNLVNKHRQTIQNAGKIKAELDYIQFQFTQLEEAKLTEGELEELELELEQLTHAEEIKTGLSALQSILEGENAAVLQQLKDGIAHFHRIYKYLPAGEELYKRMETFYIDLKDMSHDIAVLNARHDPDPSALTKVNDRLTLIYNLLKKHHTSSVGELIALREQLRKKIEEIDSHDFNMAALEKQLLQKKEEVNALALQLRTRRLKAAPSFEEKVKDLLKEVGIVNAGFKVALEPLDDFTERGSDKLQFLFSANKNRTPEDIARVASGGELSRLMLCIKSLLVDASGLPTLFFDEIDTGVSGDIAERVGNIISRMAEKMQIINITHLPQVASKGENHFLVYKTEDDHSTVTRIKLLNPEERQLEIAKMLSGEEITNAAMENARALLGN